MSVHVMRLTRSEVLPVAIDLVAQLVQECCIETSRFAGQLHRPNGRLVVVKEVALTGTMPHQSKFGTWNVKTGFGQEPLDNISESRVLPLVYGDVRLE